MQKLHLPADMSIPSHEPALSRSALLLSAELVSRILGLFFLAYSARTLGATEYGTYAFIVSLVALLAFLPDFGLNSITVRDLSRSPHDIRLIFWTNVWLRLPLWLLFLIVLQISLVLLGRRDALPVALLLALGMLGATVSQIVASVMNALEHYRRLSALSVLSVSLTVMLGYLALRAGYGLVGLAAATAAASGIHAVIAVVAAIRIASMGAPRFPAWSYVHQFLHQAIPLGLSSLFVTAYYKIDRILIGLLLGDIFVGWYDAAYRLLDGLMVIPRSFVVVLFPYLSRAFRIGSRDLALAAINRGTRLMFAMALPLAVVLTFLAPSVIDLIFGSDYVQSAGVLRLLIWAAVLMFPNALLGNALVAADRQAVVARVVGIGLVINIALNFLLIPSWGLGGAAVATIAAEAWGFVSVAYYLGRHLRSFGFLKEAIRPGLAAALLAMLLVWLRPYPLQALVPVLVIAYLVVSLMLRTFTFQELRSLVYIRGR